MMKTLLCAVPALLLTAGVSLADDLDTTPAKQLFGSVATPVPMAARAIGSYAKGCMAGAVALPVNGPYWQAMRLSRNRNWGTPQLVSFLERLAADGARRDGWRGLLVGDMAQPRGGPMITGHASHQIGLDADIWLTQMPARTLSRDEREKISAVSMVDKPRRRVDPGAWSDAQFRIIRRAASYPEVARIFVNPAIKKALCDSADANRAWLNKVRPWWGHDYHFHVRLDCPPGMAGCVAQKPPPPGDGCGAELDAWLAPPKPAKPAQPTKPAVKPRPTMLADLPAACRQVLVGPGPLMAKPSEELPADATAMMPAATANDGALEPPMPLSRPAPEPGDDAN